MSGNIRKYEVKGDRYAGYFGASEDANPDSLFTFRIEQEPLLLANVASILTTITRLHAKLLLIEHHQVGFAVRYATTRDVTFVEKANLNAISITQNSPLTVVLVVSEALGKALASLIDAVSQTRIRYDQAKLGLEQSRIETQLKSVQMQLSLRQQSEEHQIAMRARALDLQTQLVELKAQELAQREAEINMELNVRKRVTEEAWLVITRLYPSATQETQEILVQTLMEELLQLSNSTGLVAESVTPRKSA